MSEPTSPSVRYFKAVATFGSEYFEPVEMFSGRWFGLLAIPAHATDEIARAEAAKLKELSAEEAEVEFKKKQQGPFSSPPLFPMAPSAANTAVPHQDSHRAQPAASHPTASATTDLAVEDVIAPKPVRRK